MPEVVFMYVFDVKTGLGGTKVITPPSRSKKSFPAPETLAAAGFSATGKGRRLTFKISLTNNVDPKLTAADIKKIQESLNQQLVVRIATYRRIWSEALRVTERSAANRDRLMQEVSSKIQPAIASFAAFNSAPLADDLEMEAAPSAAPVQVPVDEVVEVNALPSTVPPSVTAAVVRNLEEDGEDAFIASQGQGDELADLFGGLMVGDRGGRKRRKTRSTRTFMVRRGKKSRYTRRRR
jgi:hypothetical protein